jgi:hypothetical protein
MPTLEDAAAEVEKVARAYKGALRVEKLRLRALELAEALRGAAQVPFTLEDTMEERARWAALAMELTALESSLRDRAGTLAAEAHRLREGADVYLDLAQAALREEKS